MFKKNEMADSKFDEIKDFLDMETDEIIEHPPVKVLLISIAVFLIVCCLLFMVAIPLLVNAKEIGIDVGNTAGNLVGTAVGSYRGFTEGYQKGAKNGKKDALTVDEVQALVRNEMQSIGELEVMIADVSLDHIMDIGESKDKYKALFVYDGTATYTVGVRDMDISIASSGIINVTVSAPKVNVVLSEEQNSKMAEWQAGRFTGSAQDGMKAYVDSKNAVKDSAEEKMSNQEMLLELAKESAKKQITVLVKAICGKDKEVKVNFREGE